MSYTWQDLLIDWRRVIKIIECDTAWADLSIKWIGSNVEVVKYLKDTWMIYKERFCLVWTSQIMHFGNATTSHVEGMHRAMKRDLLTARRPYLRDAVRAFQAYNERLNEQTEHRLADERIRIDTRLRFDERFDGLHTQISPFAMRKVLEHVESFE